MTSMGLSQVGVVISAWLLYDKSCSPNSGPKQFMRLPDAHCHKSQQNGLKDLISLSTDPRNGPKQLDSSHMDTFQ